MNFDLMRPVEVIVQAAAGPNQPRFGHTPTFEPLHRVRVISVNHESAGAGTGRNGRTRVAEAPEPIVVLCAGRRSFLERFPPNAWDLIDVPIVSQFESDRKTPKA